MKCFLEKIKKAYLEIKRSIKKIIEAVWPQLEEYSEEEKEKQMEFSKLSLKEYKMCTITNIDEAYINAWKFYEWERSRNSKIEKKSTLYIGTAGFIITILLNILKEYSKANNDIINILNLFFLCILVVYLARVVWFSLKVFEPRGMHRLDVQDIIGKEDGYKTRILILLLKYTKMNFPIVNDRASYMAMAQAYCRRVIWTVSIYVCLLFVIKMFIFASSFSSNMNLLQFLQNICQ